MQREESLFSGFGSLFTGGFGSGGYTVGTDFIRDTVTGSIKSTAGLNLPNLEDAIKLGDEIVIVNEQTSSYGNTFEHGTALGVWGDHSNADALKHVHALNPGKLSEWGYERAKFKIVGGDYEFTNAEDYEEAAPAVAPEPSSIGDEIKLGDELVLVNQWKGGGNLVFVF